MGPRRWTGAREGNRETGTAEAWSPSSRRWGGRGTRWFSLLSAATGWVLNRGAPSSGPQGWFSLVEELDTRLPRVLSTKQPKQAKSSDKEGSKSMNVAFLPCEMRYELAVLNRRRDFKARRGCGII